METFNIPKSFAHSEVLSFHQERGTKIETLEKVYYKDFGSVHFVRSYRAKRVRITIKSDSSKEIRVIVPKGISLKYIKDLVLSKQELIIKRVQQIREQEKEARKNGGNNEPIKVQESAQFLYDRLCELAKKYGFKFNKVSFRWQRTRWGSCSSKNNISLNIKIIRLPSDLQDYILLHELVHIRIKNHSKDFWDELEKYFPDAKKHRKELRKYHLKYL